MAALPGLLVCGGCAGLPGAGGWRSVDGVNVARFGIDRATIVRRGVNRLITARCRVGLRIVAVHIVDLGIVDLGIVVERIVDLGIVGSRRSGPVRHVVGRSGRGDIVAGFGRWLVGVALVCVGRDVHNVVGHPVLGRSVLRIRVGGVCGDRLIFGLSGGVTGYIGFAVAGEVGVGAATPRAGGAVVGEFGTEVTGQVQVPVGQ